ncbi:MAG: hypothetical protein ABL933_19220 [Methyloglobulus sp.]|nr:hypothetical protein [Methyloglobulus sp.]
MRATASNFARIILCLFWVALGLSASSAQAETFRYQYISLDQLKIPPFPLTIEGFNPAPGYFDPRAVIDNGRVYGTIFFDDFSSYPFRVTYAAVYNHGVVTILSPVEGSAYVANERGTVGGTVDDYQDNTFQAALYRGHQAKLIPLLPGVVNSNVIDLNDNGTALVGSFDADFNYINISLYEKGQSTVLDFGPTVNLNSIMDLDINNERTISGTTMIPGLGYVYLGDRGFRHDPSTGKTTMLNPLPTELHSWAFDINNRGNVLGYSYNVGKTERIGLWDKKAIFHPYFVEGTPEFPTISNELVFNDKNQIVITNVSSPAAEFGNSYLVPKPGVRLNLADLVVNPPSLDWKPWVIMDINNEGDMLGYGVDFSPFLLKRIDATAAVPIASTAPAALASSAMASKRLAVPPQVAAFRRSQMHRLMAKSGFRLNAAKGLKLRP